MKKNISVFSRRFLTKRELGIYSFVHLFLFPYRPGSDQDITWLSAEPTYMNAVTDRPYIIRQLFFPRPPPLELTVFMGSGENLSQSSVEAIPRAENAGVDYDPLATLKYDSLSPSAAFTATKWHAEPRGDHSWLVMLVSIRAPDVEHSEGHLVVILANVRQATLCLFDPDNMPMLDNADPLNKLQSILTHTALHLIGQFLINRIAGLPVSFRWTKRQVLPLNQSGPQAIQDTRDIHHAGLNIAGTDTCSAWCILFIHLMILTARNPDYVAREMVAPSQWPHLRLVIARYGAFLSNLILKPAIARLQRAARRRWNNISSSERQHRFKAL